MYLSCQKHNKLALLLPSQHSGILNETVKLTQTQTDKTDANKEVKYKLHTV